MLTNSVKDTWAEQLDARDLDGHIAQTFDGSLADQPTNRPIWR